MEIKATTKIDFEVYKKFSNFNMTKGSLARNPLIFLPVVLVLLLLNFIIDPQESLNLVLLAFIVVMAFFSLFMISYMPKKYYKSAEKMLSEPIYYLFTEDHYEVTSNGNTVVASNDCKYDTIFKVYETKEFFYIYVSTVQAHIIDKNSLSGGTAQELRQLLQGKVGEKKYKAVKC